MPKKSDAKTVEIKFLENTVHLGKIRTKGSIHEVSEDEALALIEGKHAEEAPAPKAG